MLRPAAGLPDRGYCLGPSTGPFLWGGRVNRFGIFVDAGYLLSATGKLLFDTTDRRYIVLDAQGMASALVDLASQNCGREHLRTYWYDGARDLVPTAQQLEIANLPRMKLRLGRLTSHGQKGVDSRIVRDLITLSIERAVTDVYLLGGDEDLREGVSEAQERGVRVVLVGVEPLDERNLSPTLAMEADDVIVLGRNFLEPFFTCREADLVPLVEPDNPKDPTSLGRTYALRYVEQKGLDALARLEFEASQPIPPEIDRQLLSYASRALGVSILDDESRIALREGFKSAIKDLAARPDDNAAQA